MTGRREGEQDPHRADGCRDLDTPEELEAFFKECDQRELGREPDWEAHRRGIERSVASGAADT